MPQEARTLGVSSYSRGRLTVTEGQMEYQGQIGTSAIKTEDVISRNVFKDSCSEYLIYWLHRWLWKFNLCAMNKPWVFTVYNAFFLTHWVRVTHKYVGILTIIGSDNGLSPDWRQAIIWIIDGILLIGPLGINFNEILIKILIFSFKKIHLKVPSTKWRPFRLSLC